MRNYLCIATMVLSSCGMQHGSASVKGYTFDTPALWAMKCGDFPEEHAKYVREGFEYWNSLADMEIFSETDCDSDKAVLTVEGEKEPAGAIIGAYLDNKITFRPRWFTGVEWTKTHSARHEVGHALGFWHTDDYDCLMYPAATTIEACSDEIEMLHILYPK